MATYANRSLNGLFCEISWLALRGEYWSGPSMEAVAAGSLILPGPLYGVACVVFGVGAGGAAWLRHLTASPWFSGLEPRPEDIVAAGGGAPAGHLDARAMHVPATPPWPTGALATVAVPPAPTQAEQATALALVALLRTRRKPNGYRLPVVATLPGTDDGTSSLMHKLQAHGSFVLHGGPGVGVENLHHFPLRAAITPRGGRLICVDLADYLGCWPRGGRGDLHVLPFASGQAAWAFERLVPVQDQLAALNLDLHLDFKDRDWSLADVDRIMNEYRDRLPPELDGYFTATTSDRLDGRTGVMDLVVIRRSLAPGRSESDALP